ncbi:hypothetical protein F5B22DRAFT_658670 [Xylaria bambusicola]|uniref:uncharacterized protein n=1 Tax=Xylaria bambusicola TaxID=326684 RepID=UPI002008D31C|nr:uncharacterized protein F5B22DRAFT_658670 [Xylaria bambusicola]KAI0509250.1 hypothetical protein F5B22DRAFT_658670 [Xylaria bambusicola]
MKYISFLFLLLRVSLAKMIKLDVGTDPEMPSCGSHCMVDSMFVTQCLDMNCLCHQEEYQKSLFQCLYSQCDSNEYGKALSRTISTCMEVGAEIHMVAPGFINQELLRVREADYLAGRQLAEIPGIQLRQESAPAVQTFTTTCTEHITLTITMSPTPTPFLTSSPESSSINRPWVITQSESSRVEASFSGLVLWIAIVLLQDYWFNGH